jgi:hypothetical protein
MPGKLSAIGAALLVRMSPDLLRWFTEHAPKKGSARKLPFVKRTGLYFYRRKDLEAFDTFLRQPWPHTPGNRPPVPVGIRREIRLEAHSGCAVCHHGNDGEAAHIVAVASSLNNHPENLIWLCPNHHTRYDKGHKLHVDLNGTEIRAIKARLVDSQIRYWRLEQAAGRKVLLFIKDIQDLRASMKRLPLKEQAAFLPHAESFARAASKKLGLSGRRGAVSSGGEAYRKLTADVAAAVSHKESFDDVAKDVTSARERYQAATNTIECRLCSGRGYHAGDGSCPACDGDGVIEKSVASNLDWSAFDDVTCPLCEGTGSYADHADCPYCGGDGTVEKRWADQFDPSRFRQVRCPLCKGKKSFRDYDDCPFCGGDGTVEDHRATSADLSPWELVRCPACRGRTSSECHACEGEGKVERRHADSYGQ